MYALLAAAVGLGLGARFVAAGDASHRARLGVALLLIAATTCRLLLREELLATLLFVAVAVGVLMHRRVRGVR